MHLDPNTVKDALSILNNEQVKNVLSPTTKAIGEDLADFYQAVVGDNLRKVAEGVRERRKGKRTANADDFRRIMPLLQGASVQSDEKLQDCWANLMDTAIDQSEGYLPSFGQTLSEMNADEARYIDRLWTFFLNRLISHPSIHPPCGQSNSYKLVEVYDPTIRTGISPAERKVDKDQMSEVHIANYDRLNHVQLIIQDIVRLGILSHTQSSEPRDHHLANSTLMPIKGSPTILKTDYALTHYGVNFIRAVSGDQAPNKGDPHETGSSE